MANYLAEVLTPWTTDAEGGNVMQIWTAHRRTFDGAGNIATDGIYTCEDVTGTAGPHLPPSPNLCVVRVRCPEATLDAIEADSAYLVLSSAEIVEDA
jgi:hypothetical protein